MERPLRKAREVGRRRSTTRHLILPPTLVMEPSTHMPSPHRWATLTGGELRRN